MRSPGASVGRDRNRVVGQGLTDLGGKRHPFVTAALAAHGDLTVVPVDVVQPQSGDLGGPQPKPGQQQNHRVVAAPHQTVAITGGQQRGGLLRLIPIGNNEGWCARTGIDAPDRSWSISLVSKA